MNSYRTLKNNLLFLLQTTVPPKGVELTEDSLLRHAQFICDQVESFDSAGTDGELLIVLPCMRTLMRLAGVTLGKRYLSYFSFLTNMVTCFSLTFTLCYYRRAIRKAERKSVADKKPAWTKATTTDLVRDLFDTFFTEQLDKGDEKGSQVCMK